MNRWMKVLLCDYVFTGILLAILTGLLYQFQLTEEQVDGGIMGIYVVANLCTGFFLGKGIKERRFLWGLVLGFVYYLLLFLVSLGIYHSVRNGVPRTIIAFLLCSGSGMFGGMMASYVSRN